MKRLIIIIITVISAIYKVEASDFLDCSGLSTDLSSNKMRFNHENPETSFSIDKQPEIPRTSNKDALKENKPRSRRLALGIRKFRAQTSSLEAPTIKIFSPEELRLLSLERLVNEITKNYSKGKLNEILNSNVDHNIEVACTYLTEVHARIKERLSVLSNKGIDVFTLEDFSREKNLSTLEIMLREKRIELYNEQVTEASSLYINEKYDPEAINARILAKLELAYISPSESRDSVEQAREIYCKAIDYFWKQAENVYFLSSRSNAVDLIGKSALCDKAYYSHVCNILRLHARVGGIFPEIPSEIIPEATRFKKIYEEFIKSLGDRFVDRFQYPLDVQETN